MNAGKNVWINDSGKTVKSDKRPAGDWFAHYPKSRVRGDKFTPYQGRSEWEQAANRAMAAEAQDNFSKRR